MTYVAAFGGGPYAMEELIGAAYPLITFLGIMIIPWLNGLQCALMTAELSSAMPHNAGFLVWVKEAFGEFWSFQVASFATMNTIIDLAIYPVLFCDYLNQFFHFTPTTTAIVRAIFVLTCVILSIMGAQSIGGSSAIFTIFALSPFVVMTVMGLPYLSLDAITTLPDKPLRQLDWGILLSILAWCAQGFDSISQLSEDLEDPKMFKITMISTIILIIITSIFPLAVSVSVDRNYSIYHDGYFAVIAQKIGGNALHVSVIFGACIGTLATFNLFLYTGAIVISHWVGGGGGGVGVGEEESSSIIGISMLSRKSSRWGTPYLSILFLAILVYVLSFFNFSSLIQVDQSLYAVTLIVKYGALIQLRITKPDMPRPYKIGLELKGLVLFVTPPVLFALMTIITTLMSSSSVIIYSLIVYVSITLYFPFLMNIIKRRC
eukprot:TRINITY_DN1614_c0_g3_i1.p1 TRINITY_DN1614_c0_g3~~TRINITY_DN1614_c0_g3_i1.p1  ORF type:complete len:433 (+),score=53.11 TRINITY_DN1614_c0_g3_i1:201-1499(+)